MKSIGIELTFLVIASFAGITAMLFTGIGHEINNSSFPRGYPDPYPTGYPDPYPIDTTPPIIFSITRSKSTPTTAAAVNFKITFSESVTSVETADFELTTNSITNAYVSSVNGSGDVRIVTVNTGIGDGTIRLDVIDNNTIMDLASNFLNGGFTDGEVYTIDKPELPAPILRFPRITAVINDTTPAFMWLRERGGLNYEIEFATDNLFIASLRADTIGSSTYIATAPFGDGNYFWRVRAYNASNQPGIWSAPRSFTIDTTGPTAPTLSSPTDNASSNRTPTFKWLSVPAAVLYEFQYDNDSDFSSPYDVTTRGTFRRPPAMKAGVYYWHVRAKDASGNWGDWSAPFTMTIAPP